MNFNNLAFLNPEIAQNPNLCPIAWNFYPFQNSYLFFTQFPMFSNQKNEPLRNQANQRVKNETMGRTEQNLAMPELNLPIAQNQQRILGEQDWQSASKGYILIQNNPEIPELSCQCQMSKCNKYYCFCFKNGRGCNDKCACRNCKNTQDRFRSKKWLERKKSTVCNCTRSECQKKYCQCYAAGKKCGDSCRCKKCLN